MREEALKWYQQALEDLLTAEHLFNTHRYYAVAFWSQQAAEKALRAFLIFHGKVVRSHDLNEILDIIERELSINVNEIREDANKLTIHYIVSRYPDAANSIPARIYSRNDAEDLLKRVKKVIEWVKRYLQ
jgi:HEPN domain-containing protein